MSWWVHVTVLDSWRYKLLFTARWLQLCQSYDEMRLCVGDAGDDDDNDENKLQLDATGSNQGINKLVGR